MLDHDEEGPGETPAAAPVSTCTSPGCSAPTWDGKGYCLEHVHLTPYARALAERWAKAHEVTRSGTRELDLGHPLPGDPSSEEMERTKGDLAQARRAAGVHSTSRSPR